MRAAALLPVLLCACATSEPVDDASPLTRVTPTASGPTALRYTMSAEMDLDRFTRADVSGVLEVRYDETLITRGDAITFRRTLDPDLAPETTTVGDVAPMGTHDWSLIDGEVREYSEPIEAMQSPHAESYAAFEAAPGHHELIDWQRAAAELAAGYGLRWRTIEAETTTTDSGVLESGRLRIGLTEEAQFTGVYDDDGVLREARISLVQDDAIRRLLVTTTGTTTVNGVPFATHGEAVLRLEPLAGGAGAELSRFTAEFQDFAWLSPEEYDALATITPPTTGQAPVPSDAEEEETRQDSGEGRETGEKEEEKCADCEEEWVKTSELLGANECEHGYENDTSPACLAAVAAGADPLCAEAGGACDCFTCQGIPYKDPFSIDCEGEIQDFMAWCELGDPELECKTEKNGTGVKKKLITQTPVGGVCNGSHGSMVQTTLCGDPESLANGLVTGACLATNCASTGNLQATQKGDLFKCK